MMYEVSALLDRVIEQIGAKNDLDLARRMGLSTGHISLWRNGKRSPDPDRLAQLYELAGLDPTEALLTKGAELSKGPARKYYQRLLSMVNTLCLAVLVQAVNNQALLGKDCILWKI